MKKAGLFSLVALFACISAANAELPTTGKLGLGYADTISGLNGLTIGYGVAKNMRLEGMIGMSFDSPKDNDGMGHNIGFGLGFFFDAMRSNEAAFTVGARLDVGMTKPHKEKGGQDPDGSTELDIDIPVRIDYFPTKNVSFHLETGIGIHMIPKEGEALGHTSKGEGNYFSIFDIGTGFGMTYWL